MLSSTARDVSIKKKTFINHAAESWQQQAATELSTGVTVMCSVIINYVDCPFCSNAYQLIVTQCIIISITTSAVIL